DLINLRNGSNGSISGPVRFEGERSSLEFDGYNDYVYVPSVNLSGASGFTIEAWFKAYPKSGTGFIIGRGDYAANRSYIYYADNLLYFRARNASNENVDINSGIAIAARNWTHVAITYNSSQFRLYINGEFKSEANETDFNLTALPVYIGSQGSGSFFRGLIDEVRVSDSVRYGSGSFGSDSGFNITHAPFTRDSHTRLLLHFDEYGNDTRFDGRAMDDSDFRNDAFIFGANYKSESPIPSSGFASHAGIFIEEGTTNEIYNPSFENNASFSLNWYWFNYSAQVNITNTNINALEAGSPVVVTVDTDRLNDRGLLLTNASDLRIAYINSSELVILKSYIQLENNSFSYDTRIYFRLRQDLASGSSDSNYYLLFANPDATYYKASDADAFAFNDSGSPIIAAPLDKDTFNLAGSEGSSSDDGGSGAEQGNLTGDVEYKAFDLILRSYNITMSGINDIYVYDTAKDTISDDWRCNSSLSWYTEPESSTRGARRCFPRKALIAVNDTNLVIYDTADMMAWMIFGNKTGSMLEASELSSVFALNGKVYVGTAGTTPMGLYVVDFRNDSALRYDNVST
ncbi:hypothetical protein COV22_00925, partial [Candidatus Woesearchaeota archaeon CG10_big_fil_rev_8_21_14_0_10_47_5]